MARKAAQEMTDEEIWDELVWIDHEMGGTAVDASCLAESWNYYAREWNRRRRRANAEGEALVGAGGGA